MSRLNLGVDIEEVGRFRRLVRSARFMNRVFTKREIEYCSSKKKKLQHFAVRFAAKEAIWKALSDFLREKKKALGHRDIGISNDMTGKPTVMLPKPFAGVARKISVSLSHTSTYVVAVAVYQK